MCEGKDKKIYSILAKICRITKLFKKLAQGFTRERASCCNLYLEDGVSPFYSSPLPYTFINNLTTLISS